MNTLYIFNTTIIPTPGHTYRSKIIGLVEARSMVGAPVGPEHYEADRVAGIRASHVTWISEEIRSAAN